MKVSQNFSNFESATAILYIVASPDSFPTCMHPSLDVSEYYFIFFIGYIILF